MSIGMVKQNACIESESQLKVPKSSALQVPWGNQRIYTPHPKLQGMSESYLSLVGSLTHDYPSVGSSNWAAWDDYAGDYDTIWSQGQAASFLISIPGRGGGSITMDWRQYASAMLKQYDDGNGYTQTNISKIRITGPLSGTLYYFTELPSGLYVDYFNQFGSLNPSGLGTPSSSVRVALDEGQTLEVFPNAISSNGKTSVASLLYDFAVS